MNYYLYKKNLFFIFIALLITILILVLNSYQAQSGKITSTSFPFLSTLLYYVSRILFLYLLFFSIYAYMSGVKGTRKLETPIILIIIGALLVITSFGPPILSFFMMSDTITEVFIKVDSTEARKEAMNKNSTSKRRLEIAENHYLATGESISYLNNENGEVLYAPDDKRSKLTEELKSSVHQLDLAKTNLRITALSLLVTLIISSIIFIVFLWYKFKVGALGHNKGA